MFAPARGHPKSPAMLNKWEASDPTKDIQELYRTLDTKFFQDKMKKYGVLLELSEKAKSNLAGYCYQLNDAVHGGKRCYIILNRPLLILRSRTDVVETLMHEMIHALLYISNIDENHGPNFRRIMKNINKVAGTNITVYHRFYDEVDHCEDFEAVYGAKDKKQPEKKILFPDTLPRVNPGHMVPSKFPMMPRPPRLQRQKSESHGYIMSEILDSYKGKIPGKSIKIIGYDDSDDSDNFSDSDSDSGEKYEKYLQDKAVADWKRRAEDMQMWRELFPVKNDYKNWMHTNVLGRR